MFVLIIHMIGLINTEILVIIISNMDGVEINQYLQQMYPCKILLMRQISNIICMQMRFVVNVDTYRAEYIVVSSANVATFEAEHGPFAPAVPVDETTPTGDDSKEAIGADAGTCPTVLVLEITPASVHGATANPMSAVSFGSISLNRPTVS